MNDQATTIFSDEVLRFLYSSPMFQQLDEHEQRLFLQTFRTNRKLQALLDVAIEVQQSILEMEAIVPSILPTMQTNDEVKQYHMQLKARAAQHDNVYYVPFTQPLKSPYIVLLQQSANMANVMTYMLGLVLPLLNVCAKQKRDFILVPFANKAAEPIVFQQGKVHVDKLKQLLQLPIDGQAEIIPALQKALTIFEQDFVQQQPELFIVTNLQLTDFDKLVQCDVASQLHALNVETSVVATSEQQFERTPLVFAQKMYFVDEQ